MTAYSFPQKSILLVTNLLHFINALFRVMASQFRIFNLRLTSIIGGTVQVGIFSSLTIQVRRRNDTRIIWRDVRSNCQQEPRVRGRRWKLWERAARVNNVIIYDALCVSRATINARDNFSKKGTKKIMLSSTACAHASILVSVYQ